ncbi:class IV adenylate cyclase [Hymenobacter latericus]|uniref:class IV adenylate cyclase n=1 Tax=Hymenobacter sp. YIM 151858-1 TaxID=2987688 RepID=UPI002226AAF9|nr:CYTH domain-containing protein [Hymenobacter sp. YIM 151858-1]UYZ59833.1 CYTH domain-containing protein [Hymenobacter sp. YIM 151858-1]
MSSAAPAHRYQDFSAKARCSDAAPLAAVLDHLGAHFIGTDHQRDTYYATSRGKLKLREGNIEHILIHYERLPDAHGLERTHVYRYDQHPTPELLTQALAGRAVLGVVEKTRRIYRLGHIKIHLDLFATGEQFVEVEVQDHLGQRNLEQLREECLEFLQRLGIAPGELLNNGYLPQPNT